MWERVKKFFHDSETIFIARLTAAVGLILAGMASVDWTPVLSATGLDVKQLLTTGVIVFIQGVVIELARRRRTSIDPL